MNEGLIILIILVVLIIYVVFRRKKAAKLKAKGKAPFGKTYFGCTLPALIMICIFIVSIFIFVPIMKENYDRLEKEANKKTFDKVMSFFNSSNDYQDLSNTQKKNITVKLFLLQKCIGGDETLKELIAYEQNILYDACFIVQNNGIIEKFSENNDDPKSFHMQVLNADFKGAVKLYDWYITE